MTTVNRSPGFFNPKPKIQSPDKSAAQPMGALRANISPQGIDSLSQSCRHRRQCGFTLIEIMVVVIILGVLGALVIPNIVGRTGEARVTAAKSDIRAIGSALNLYKLDNFNYPSTDQGLKALVEKPGGVPEAKNWNPEGYLEKLPVDPWGNDYQYISPGSKGKYDLFSLGADGRPGGEGEAADIYN